MSTLTIVEGQGIGKQQSGSQQAMMLPFITIQRVTFTGTAGYSAALNRNTTLVRIYTDANASMIVGASSASVGSLTGVPLVASTVEYFSVAAGSAVNYISVVAIS